MTRPVLLILATMLALATGLGLLGFAMTLSQSPITVAPTTASAAAAVRRFYAAADLALRTGDATALADAVSPGYVDHAVAPTILGGVLEYTRFLSDVRAACPDCRLTAEDLAVNLDQAAVRVTVQGHRQVTAAGVMVDEVPLVWSALEVLRIEDGQVAERWGRGDPQTPAEPRLIEVPADLKAGTAALQVVRFFLGPGTCVPPVEAAGPVLLVVEEGGAVVESDRAGLIDNGNGLSPGLVHTVAQVGQGERLALAPGRRHTVRGEGSATTVVLVLTTVTGATQLELIRPTLTEPIPPSGVGRQPSCDSRLWTATNTTR